MLGQQDQQEQEWLKKLEREIWKYLLALVGLAAVMMLIGTVLRSDMITTFGTIGLFALLGIMGLAVIFPAKPKPGIRREHLEGSKLRALNKPQDRPGLPIGFARMPAEVEPMHTVIEGANGRGKTQILKNMLDFIRARGDTVVVVDSNYELHKTFGRPDDVILSIFDDGSPGWLPLNEIRRPSDWSAMARSLISEGEGNAAEWHAMARAMFAAVGRRYQEECERAGVEFDHGEFFKLLTSANAEILRPLLEGTTASSLLENDRGLSSVRMTFLDALAFWDEMRPGDFSVREWVEGDPAARPSIWIPHRKSELATSKTLISCWLDWMINAACDGGESTQRAWIIIDELSSLGEVGSLKTAVTELRKTGFRVVVGIQDYAQVQSIYGQTSATTIMNNLSSKVVLGANDPDTAERNSRMLGEARNRIKTITQSASESTPGSRGNNGSRTFSENYTDQVERVVLASEIMALPPLQGFVKFAGTDEILFTKIAPYAGGQNHGTASR